MDFLSSDVLPVAVLVVYILFSAAAVASHIFNLPGNFIILAFSVLLGWYEGFESINLKIIIVLAVIAALAELVDFVIGVIGAKRYKSTNRAIFVSIVFGLIGGVLMSPVLFGLGALIGAFAGAYIGALLVELAGGKSLNDSLNSAWGVFLGRLGGVFSKVVLGLIMVIITVKSFL